MRRALTLLLCVGALGGCGEKSTLPPGTVRLPPATVRPVSTLVAPLPHEDDWRRLLSDEPGQATLDYCLALAGRGGSPLERASGRACLANIALLGCPPGEKGRCADDALVQIGAALELAPEAGRLHLGRLRILLDAERGRDLAAALLDSLDRRPGSPGDADIWMGYAAELIENKNLRAAAAFTEALRSRFPDDPQVLATLGACLTDLGRSEQAGRVLEHAIEVAPDDALINWSMGWHHHRSGRLDSARAYFETALAAAPDAATLAAWGCDYGRVLEQAADLARGCALQREHCPGELSAPCRSSRDGR